MSDSKQLCDKERSARAQLAERVEKLQKSLDHYKHELDEAEASLRVIYIYMSVPHYYIQAHYTLLTCILYLRLEYFRC